MQRRLFFALWPSDQCRAEMRVAARPLHSATRGRKVPSANYHITLAFVGDIPDDRIPLLVAAARNVRFSPTTLKLDRVGCFRGSRVVWLGCSDVPGELSRLVRELEHALAGVVGESVFSRQAYCPHVTVLRRQPSLPECPPSPAITWPVTEFVLVESRLVQGGATYSIIEQFSASGPC